MHSLFVAPLNLPAMTAERAAESTTTPRTLAEELRGRSDAQLTRLLTARPDIASPPPADMTQVGSRAATGASVSWALDRLDTAHLAVLHTIGTMAPPSALQQVRDSSPLAADYVAAAVRNLRDLALVWGPDDALHVVREAREMARATASAAWVGHGVRETPPAPTASDVDTGRVDQTCAGTVLELVQRAEQLLESWSTAPPTVLRSGGVGVREIRTTAVLLGVDTADTEFLIDLVGAAGLLGRTDDGAVWLPTAAYDRWRDGTIAERWTRLATAWADSPGRVIRRQTLRVLDHLRPAAFADESDVVAAVAWQTPRLGAGERDALVSRTLTEATSLGVVALDALTSAGAAIATGTDPTSVLEGLLPRPVDHVLLQADLTAIAPGPLEHSVARQLGEIAALESRGGAAVYRFTADSVRRGLDLGWPADQVHDFLAQHSRTPIPQPLTYLVDDVARRHGRLRVGDAGGYLRTDDPAELDALLVDAGLSGLLLHRVAPTVALSELPADLVIARLRAGGHNPVPERTGGALEVERPRRRRAPSTPVVDRRRPDVDAIVAAVRAGDSAARSRPTDAGDSAPMGRTGSMHTVAALRDAAEAESSVWLSYLDQAGSLTERVVDPVRVDAGWLTAYDHRSGRKQSFAIHRVTRVAGADESPVRSTGSDEPARLPR